MKRDWSGMSGLAGLGLSRSMLKIIDSSQNALGVLDRVGGIGAAARATGTLKAGVGLPKLSAGARMEGITGKGMGSAWSALSAAKKANSSAAFGKPVVNLAGRDLKEAAGIGKFPLLTAAQNLGLGKASRSYPALDALLGPAKGASPLYSAGRVSDLAGVIPKSTALGIPQTMLGAGSDLSAARSVASFLGSGTWAGGLFASAPKGNLLSGLPKGTLAGASVRTPGKLGADAGAWQYIMALSKTSRLFGPPRELGLFGVSGAGFLREAFPALSAFDTVRQATGMGLGSALDVISGINLEALREAALIREARRPRTRIGFAALNAYDELYMGHPWVANKFLLDYLGIQPNDDRREALWKVLREAFERTLTYPARWIVLADDQAAAYLRDAVYNEADRVERDREWPDRVWWTARDPETKKKIELRPTLQPDDILELMMKRSGDPADIVIPPPDDRGRVLEMLYIEGTEQDKRMVGMIISGFDLAAIAHVVGWPEVQRFQRKAQRWKIKLDSSSGG